MRFNDVMVKIDLEAELSPSKRTQQVPCAYCTRGGNGDRSCSCGMNERRYSIYKGCFAGTMLEKDPTAK